MKSKIQFLISTIFKTTVQQNPNQLFKEEIVSEAILNNQTIDQTA